MRCKKCGEELEEGAKFCSRCGEPVERQKKKPKKKKESAEVKRPEKKKEAEKYAEKKEKVKKKPEKIEVPAEGSAEMIEKKYEEVMKAEEKEAVSEPASPEVPAEKKRSTVLIVMGVLIFVFVVIAVVGFYYLYYLPSQVVFSDEFETLDSRVWGMLRKGDNLLVKAQGGELVVRNGAVYLKRDVGNDYIIECGVNVIGVSDKNGWGGIIFRMGTSGSYILQLAPDLDRIVLRRHPGYLIVRKDIKLEKGRWYLVAVKAEGENLACFINHKQIIGIKDIGLAKGGVGLESGNATVLFRDFVIK